jgi:hypothetical protein
MPGPKRSAFDEETRSFSVLRTTKIAVAFVFASALAVAFFSTNVGQAQQTAADGGDKALAARLGADDGYALAIHYSADIHGSLETCG